MSTEHKKCNKNLPCITFVSTGSCKYNNKCNFLHSKSIYSNYPINKKEINIKQNKHSQIDHVLVWPKIEYSSDNINSEYILSYPKNNNIHNISLYSMWSHFEEFCKITNMERELEKLPKLCEKPCMINNISLMDPYYTKNNYTSKNRLNTFCKLSNGISPFPNNYQSKKRLKIFRELTNDY